MIKLDDSSDLDCIVVQEYQRNSIADDSEDEKLVNRALSKDERKTKSEKTKRRTRTTSYNNDGSVEDIC
jgi:hypothetical protein